MRLQTVFNLALLVGFNLGLGGGKSPSVKEKAKQRSICAPGEAGVMVGCGGWGGGGRRTPNLLVFSAYDVSCHGGSAPRLSESTNTARHPLSQAKSAVCQPGPASGHRHTQTHTQHTKRR